MVCQYDTKPDIGSYPNILSDIHYPIWKLPIGYEPNIKYLEP